MAVVCPFGQLRIARSCGRHLPNRAQPRHQQHAATTFPVRHTLAYVPSRVRRNSRSPVRIPASCDRDYALIGRSRAYTAGHASTDDNLGWTLPPWPAVTRSCDRARSSCARRSPSRISSSSRCRTRARRSGTSRTRRGSSRPSCSARIDPDVRLPVQQLLRGARAARRARAARDAVAADRSSASTRTAPTSIARIGARARRRRASTPRAARARPAPRAAASRADPDRPQVHARHAAAAARVSRAISPRGRRRWPRAAGAVRRVASSRSAHAATASRSTTSARATRARRSRSSSRPAPLANADVHRVHRRRRLSRRRSGGSPTAGSSSRAERWERRCTGAATEHYTLGGVRAIDPDETACHLSYYEADAIARWRGARLPTEAEWELAAARSIRRDGNFADDDRLHPGRASRARQMFGDVWEWTPVELLAVSRVSAARGRARRVQRQVHVGPAGAARRLVLHAARSRSRVVSQLLPARARAGR